MWIFTARLVTGQGLPYMAEQWAVGAGILFAITTVIRAVSVGKSWRQYIPGGVAVAIGESFAKALCSVKLLTQPDRHVQCAILYPCQSHWRFRDLVLGECEEEIKHTTHYSCISKSCGVTSWLSTTWLMKNRDSSLVRDS